MKTVTVLIALLVVVVPKTQELLVMKSKLEHLVHCCHGDYRPEFPILDVLASDEPVASARISARNHERRNAVA